MTDIWVQNPMEYAFARRAASWEHLKDKVCGGFALIHLTDNI